MTYVVKVNHKVTENVKTCLSFSTRRSQALDGVIASVEFESRQCGFNYVDVTQKRSRHLETKKSVTTLFPRLHSKTLN